MFGARNNEFWLLPLDNKSKLLTAFLTSWARYCWKTLPFGKALAPEIFQKMQHDIIVGSENKSSKVIAIDLEIVQT